MRVAAVQLDLAWEDRERNHARAAEHIARAAAGGAELVVLPEMFATGFSMAAAARAEAPDGPTPRFLAAQARQHGVHLVTSVALQGPDGPQNVALHHDPEGALRTRQPKLHPFRFAGEDRHFRAGSTLATSPVGGHVLGLAVCYDLRFPELFRALAFRGVTLQVVVANWPTARSAAWSHLLVARAIENQCFVVGVNRVGRGGGLDHDGRSAIVGPLGEVLATERDREVVLTAELDPRLVADTRARFPFLGDARADLFPGLHPAAGRDG